MVVYLPVCYFLVCKEIQNRPATEGGELPSITEPLDGSGEWPLIETEPIYGCPVMA